jgi:hypothetical protein
VVAALRKHSSELADCGPRVSWAAIFPAADYCLRELAETLDSLLLSPGYVAVSVIGLCIMGPAISLSLKKFTSEILSLRDPECHIVIIIRPEKGGRSAPLSAARIRSTVSGWAKSVGVHRASKGEQITQDKWLRSYFGPARQSPSNFYDHSCFSGPSLWKTVPQVFKKRNRL